MGEYESLVISFRRDELNGLRNVGGEGLGAKDILLAAGDVDATEGVVVGLSVVEEAI